MFYLHLSKINLQLQENFWVLKTHTTFPALKTHAHIEILISLSIKKVIFRR